MDDEYDDDSRSPSPSLSSPVPLPLSIAIARPSTTPPTNAQPSNPVTVASSSPHQILTLALPIQPPLGSSGGGGGGGGGREDCWSEGATSVLIDAWGERYLELSRGNLRQKQWQEVADVVSSRDDYSKAPKSDAQCKNRIDTLKKKYKMEKSKMVPSSWPFFNRLDLLLGPTVKPSPSHTTIPKKQRTNLSAKRKASTPSSTSDSLPPTANGKRRALPEDKTRELTRAILRFGEVYQRVESSKLQQSMEMERQRMEFSRELEEQRMHFFLKTQIELSQLKRHCRPSSGSGGGGNNHHRHRRGQQASANRNNNGNQSFGGGLM